jgi:hypothetical protein
MPWRRIGEVDVELHAFLNSTIDGGEWSVSRSGRFTPAERPHGTGGSVGPRNSLDEVVKRKIPSPRRESKLIHKTLFIQI